MARPKQATSYQWYPVHWSEGMFLRPHHLQAADRHARDMLAASEDWYHPFNYGFHSVEIDRAALRDRVFKLDGCEARFADGTRLSVPADGAPDPVKLTGEMLRPPDGVAVLLAVPRWRRMEGRPNVENGPGADGVRYTVEAREVEDENTGGNELEVEFRRLRCRLITDGQPHEGYVTLPVARVIQSESGAPMLDPGFVPPLLAFDAYAPLCKPVQALHRLISTRIDALIAQLPGSGRLYETQDPGEAERVLKLSALNAAYAHLGSLAYTRGMTPLAVFHELRRLAGHLAIFTPARRPGDLPAYDHDALAECFGRVLAEIRFGLDAATYSAYEVRHFEGHPEGPPDGPTVERLRVAFDPEWRVRGRTPFLGVRGVDAELSAGDCERLLREIGMKLGGAAGLGSLVTGRLRDFRLLPVPERPRVLPPSYVYYRIEGDESAWRDVVGSGALVVQVNPTRVTPHFGPPAPPPDRWDSAGEAEAEPGAATEAGPVVRTLLVEGRKISFALFIV
jgi:type VI secretion system protein ImpJ